VPTLLLTERLRAECSLSGEDLEFLLAEHGHHLHIVPTRRPSVYRLTPTRLVGLLVAPTCRLVIRPKIPLRSLYHLLDPSATPPAVTSVTPEDVSRALLDFLALRLVALLEERLAVGLHRWYAEQEGEERFLQGRLDVAAQLRQTAARPDQFHCRRDEFTFDVPCNQVPRAVLELLLRSPLLGAAARASLGQALQGLDGVQRVELTAELFERATADRTAALYRPLLELCRLLADSLQQKPGVRPGSTAGPAFLLDLERVFERYVTRGLVEAFTGGERFTVAGQLGQTFPSTGSGQPGLLMRPDVTVCEGNEPRAVVDAKWKRLPPHGKVTADLYQVLAYCTALGVGRGVLVYPGRADHCRTYRLSRSGVRIEVRTLRITAGPHGCRRSLCRLGRALRAGVS
jgi:5-methylcytosine-specific restriction enzyme subunit McrC